MATRYGGNTVFPEVNKIKPSIPPKLQPPLPPRYLMVAPNWALTLVASLTSLCHCDSSNQL